MNDRFKFRIWHEGKMHYNDFVITSTGYAAKIDEEFLGKCVFNQENLEFNKQAVVMQCIGLKDKNGKLIYEGDILGGTYGNLYIHYCDNCKQFQLKANDYGCMACEGDIHWCELVEDENEIEVIGNIYENKELLE